MFYKTFLRLNEDGKLRFRKKTVKSADGALVSKKLLLFAPHFYNCLSLFLTKRELLTLAAMKRYKTRKSSRDRRIGANSQ